MDHQPPDASGDAIVESTIALVDRWLVASEGALDRGERQARRRMGALIGDPDSVAFTMAFCDRVIRPESDRVAVQQLQALAAGHRPRFLSSLDWHLLRAGARVGPLLPSVVMTLARRRLRQIVGGLVADADDRALAADLEQLRIAHYRVNTNLLGEYVLGEGEASRRLAATIDLLRRPDVDYVSVKVSSVTSRLNLWDHDRTVERIIDNLRPLFREAASGPGEPKFLNLDMEEYRDLHLTVDALRGLLDEPEFERLDAGIVLQAYLPDSLGVLADLVAWAADRHRRAGGTIKVRVVKGANLAMEAVDAAMHGWVPAPYATKAETDANYKRMLDWAFDPTRLAGVRIGVASHNLFDLAWARLLAEARSVSGRVEFEMLQGMAPGIDRTVMAETGTVLLYTPVVAAADFDHAVAYLFRRLEENSSADNFLHSVFQLASDPAVLAAERARFVDAVAARWQVSSVPRRRSPHPPAVLTDVFENAPDSDPTDPAVRQAIADAVAGWVPAELPAEILDPAGIDRAIAGVREGARAWAADPEARRAILHRVGVELAARRVDLVAVMAHEAHKVVAEADAEVSEAIDFAHAYALAVGDLSPISGARFEPLGTVVVVPPWNFPVAIAAGGVLAALAAGNSVVLKPAPQTPRCGLAVAEACWAAGVPRDALAFVRCPDEGIGDHLIGHAGIDGIILTGAAATAELFARLAPATPLFAETSGKNVMVVMPDADLDLAAADLVMSAFGYGGQKCSAASLAVCVGEVAGSPRFRRQVVDAARSLVLGPATDLGTGMGPLIGPPGPDLERALTQLDPGERWLLAPRLVDADSNLWSPGIKDGVRPGSWFHRTECFGPVLGLMAAADLDEAIRIQNQGEFGLTGGIHTLDPANVETWLDRVEVGNAYVNRAITGAIVGRQPFGGWKRSVVGPGAKAGGPNYVAQLGRWHDPDPVLHAEGTAPGDESPPLSVGPGLDAAGERWLAEAIEGDAVAAGVDFDREHDPSALFCEANRFRYRPLRSLVVRIERDARPEHVLRVLAAAERSGSPIEVSVHPGFGPEPPGWPLRREDADALVRRLATSPVDRIRVVGSVPVALASLGPFCQVDGRTVVADGRIEGLRYRREQVVSRTLHRFGNLTGGQGLGGAQAGTATRVMSSRTVPPIGSAWSMTLRGLQ